ncbi:MAG TPA: response regulator [Cyanobacteria bacterium UBA8543]|nr:response regulator [Cyanobacteria bacterium UBA8543]
MSTHKVFTPNYLAKQIQDCANEQFTGRLDLNFKAPKDQQWTLYFYRGSLIWCTSEMHPIRRWYRQMSLHCPQLVVERVALTSSRSSVVSHKSVWLPCLDYASLSELMRQGKIQRGQMGAVIEGNITEILFDIHQQWERVGYSSELQLTYKPIPKNIIDLINSTLILIRVDQAWQQAIQAWEAWQQAGLGDYSPNRAPTIWKAEELRRKTSAVVYSNLTQLVDGHQTLRDLAVKLKQNLLPLTQSIMPYIREGLIGLSEVEDINCSVKPITANTTVTSPPATPTSLVQPPSIGSLVVCIDDSRIDSQAMNQILSQAGYRCINIQDPVKALPILLEHKPALIFLDLVMPVANGYEICAQIRRISAFKDTPIIILTSNDGIVDRVRAKMVGSSGFLAKPIDSDKVLKVLHRYLASPTPIQSQRLQTIQE